MNKYAINDADILEMNSLSVGKVNGGSKFNNKRKGQLTPFVVVVPWPIIFGE